MQACCYSARGTACLPAVRCIHYKCVVGYLTVGIGSLLDGIIRGHRLPVCNAGVVDYPVDYWMRRLRLTSKQTGKLASDV